jgi:hypothetical protein
MTRVAFSSTHAHKAQVDKHGEHSISCKPEMYVVLTVVMASCSLADGYQYSRGMD